MKRTKTMEDTNAKRDARRRRILGNVEKRLSKITGRSIDKESKESSHLATSSRASHTFASMDTKEDISEANINGTISDRFDDKITDVNSLESIHTWNDTLTTSRYNRNDVTTEAKDIHSTFTGFRILPSALLTNRWNYVLLAVVVNVLLVLQLDHLFGKTITIPYFPIALGRLYNCIDTQESQNGSLLYTALILCNIKPELTYQFKKLVFVFHIILGDLALYIFSFTLIHYGLLYCLQNTDIPAPLND